MSCISNIPIYINKNLIQDYLSVISEGYINSITIKSSNDSDGSIEIESDKKKQTTSSDKSITTSCDSSQEFEFKLGIKDETDKKKSFSTFYYFIQIRDILYRKKMLKFINRDDIINGNVTSGEFIEFTSSLSDISVASQIDTVINILSSYNPKTLDELLKDKIDGITNFSVIINHLKNLLSILSRNNTNDVIMDLDGTNAVLSLNTNNFTDKTAYMFDTAGSKCTVLCKVIKASKQDSNIDLLRKTGDSNYYNSFLTSLNPYFKILQDNKILIPYNFTTVINGPSVLCLPLSMYV